MVRDITKDNYQISFSKLLEENNGGKIAMAP